MKFTKQNRSLLLALSLSITITTINCMEQGPSNKWITGIAIVGSILLGKVALQTLWQQPGIFPFADLPEDIQKEIITLLLLNEQAKTLDEATKPIRALSMVNKQFHELLNDETFTQSLIKHLSERFDEGYLSIAKSLGTQTAKKLYDEEDIKIRNAQELMNSIYKHNTKQFDTSIQKPNINSDIRVLYTQWTALMLSVSLPQNSALNNFTISEQNRHKHYLWCHENNITQRLLQHSALAKTINQRDFAGNTALLLALVECAKQQNCELIKPSIKVILDYGANPQLANDKGLTPLQAAINTNDKEIIQMIYNRLQPHDL